MPYQPAILGTARLGNFRLGYVPVALAQQRAARVRVLIAGLDANARVRRAGLSIHDAINDEANTCTFVVDGTAPIPGQDVRISINTDSPRLLFNGTLQTVDASYEGGVPANLVWSCTAVDDLVRLNRIRPFGTWTTVSATTIAQSLITSFAPGFTSTYVEAALPAVSIIFDGSETFSSCLARLAQAIGGYFYVEDLSLHFFLTESTTLPDTIDTTPDRFLNDPPLTIKTDDSQLRTRVYGKGHGENVLSDVAALDTILPIPDAAMFNPLGGKAIAGTTPDGAQSQRLTYTGIQVGGGGSLVGPGAAPSSAPTLALQAGAGMTAGLHDVAVVFVTASGKSVPGPKASITTLAGYNVPPPSAPGASISPTGNDFTYNPGDSLYYVVTYLNASGETTPSSASPTVIAVAHGSGGSKNILVSGINDSSDPSVTSKRLYRNVNGSWVGYWVVAIGTTGTNSLPAPTAGSPPGSNGAAVAAQGQIALTGIPLGPTSPVATTARELYASLAGGGARKLALTISDNTTTTGTITASDATLTAAAAEPTSDTSGLAQPTGQVLPGSTSLLIAGLAPFQSGGGWAFTGTQVIRYTGFTGASLTGIPASGDGSILQALTYNTVIAAAPALVGVTGNTLAMLKGTPVHIWVQRDDLSAQAALIALDAAQGRTSTGVVEFLIVDQRRGEASLIAMCDAQLQLYSRPLVTVTFDGRDTRLKAGKPVTFNLTTPAVATTLTIQSCDISEIDIVPAGLAPRFHVVASNVSVSLESLLRKLLTKAAS